MLKSVHKSALQLHNLPRAVHARKAGPYCYESQLSTAWEKCAQRFRFSVPLESWTPLPLALRIWQLLFQRRGRSVHSSRFRCLKMPVQFAIGTWKLLLVSGSHLFSVWVLCRCRGARMSPPLIQSQVQIPVHRQLNLMRSSLATLRLAIADRTRSPCPQPPSTDRQTEPSWLRSGTQSLARKLKLTWRACLPHAQNLMNHTCVSSGLVPQTVHVESPKLPNGWPCPPPRHEQKGRTALFHSVMSMSWHIDLSDF